MGVDGSLSKDDIGGQLQIQIVNIGAALSPARLLNISADAGFKITIGQIMSYETAGYIILNNQSQRDVEVIFHDQDRQSY
jgi:hypothetical protein